MASLAYRLTVFEERATQSNLATEPDVLAADGTVHSDSFQVATLTGVSGFQPYLEMPEGRTSRYDELSRRTDQGQMTFRLLDPRTTVGGAHANRWVTGFLNRLKPGCKVLCEESEDDGSTWADWWTGRIESVRLAGRVAMELRCRDMLADLARHEAFVGRPNSAISYAAEPLLLPLGLSAAFGTQPAATLLGGTIATDGIYRTITFNAASKGRKENVVTQAMIRSARIPLSKTNHPLEVRPAKGLRVRFTAGSVTQKEGHLVKMEVQRRSRHFQVNKLWIRVLESSSDPYYTALDTGTIANSTAVSNLAIRQAALADGGGDTPLLIDGVRGPELIADLLDGKFGRLNADGTVNRAFPRDSSSFTTPLADDSFPLLRFILRNPARLKEFVETHVLRQSGLAWRTNASGEIVLMDVRPPSASPTSTTITEADLADGTLPDWEFNRDQAINVIRATTFVDFDRDADTLGDAYVPAVPTTLLESVETGEDIQIGDNYDLGYKPHDIPCEGFRTFPNETLDNQDRAQVLSDQVMAMASHFRDFGAGRGMVTLLAARTANTDVHPGEWRLLDIDVLPDPATKVRGGTLLARCLERTDQPSRGLHRRLRFAVAGPNTVASAPTVGTPAQETSNTANGITVAVTLNASSEVALLWVHTTATSVGTRPADDAAGWRLVTPIGQIDPYIRATGTVTVRPVAAGKRQWVRVATATVIGSKLQSVYAYPSGTGYVDSASLTAPNTAAIGSVSTKAGLLTWSNNGDDVSGVEIWLASGASEVAAEAATPVRYRVLPPGTTGYQLTGLDTTLSELGTAGPWYYPQVKHADGYGGYSSAAEIAGVSFEATGSASTAPDMAAVLVTRDNSNSPYPGSAGAGYTPVGESGIELKLVAAPTGLGLDIELERAPDSGGSPGTYATIATLPAIGSVAQLYRDMLPRNGATYWYRARQSGAGVSAGGYSTAVSASPGWLPLIAFGQGLPEEATLGKTKTIRFPFSVLLPLTSTDYSKLTYFYGSTVAVAVNGSSQTATLAGPIILPRGITLTAFRTVMAEASSGGGASCKLYRDTTVLATNTDITGSPEETAISQEVGGETYWVWLQLSTTTLNQVWLEYFELDYIPSGYGQTI